MSPDDEVLTQLLVDVRAELVRLAEIIDGRHEQARLQPPHGQTSNRPHRLVQEIDRYFLLRNLHRPGHGESGE